MAALLLLLIAWALVPGAGCGPLPAPAPGPYLYIPESADTVLANRRDPAQHWDILLATGVLAGDCIYDLGTWDIWSARSCNAAGCSETTRALEPGETFTCLRFVRAY